MSQVSDAGLPSLLILVTAGCSACARVPAIADEVRRLRPGVVIHVVDVDVQGIPAGAPFVGTPTYLVEDRIVSLGNPSPDALVAILERFRPQSTAGERVSR